MRTSEHALHDPYLSSTAIKSQQITTQQSSTSRGGMNGFVFIREAINIRAAKQMLLSDSAMHTMDALSWECCGERK
jgi:hypothetical protein